MTDRHKNNSWGLNGGGEGEKGATLFQKFNEKEWKNATELYGKPSPSKFSNISIKKGDRVKLIMPGGGGYGNPKDRDILSLKNDIEDGLISADSAKEIYNYRA